MWFLAINLSRKVFRYAYLSVSSIINKFLSFSKICQKIVFGDIKIHQKLIFQTSHKPTKKFASISRKNKFSESSPVKVGVVGVV